MLHSLAGRRHRPGVLVRLVGQRPAKWCDAVALGVRRRREVRRARHAERLEQLGCARTSHHGAPRSRATTSPSRRVAEVAVVEVLPRRRPPRRCRRWRPAASSNGDARRALPPRADRLALHARRRARAATRTVASAYPRLRARTGRSGRRATSSPSSRSCSTSTAVRVLVIEPIRYCMSRRASPGTSPAPPTQASAPSRSTPATTDGSRPLRPGAAAEPGRRRPVAAAHSAKASGGGQAQTRLRSPYAWSMRATGGQYLSGSTPAGKTAELARVGAVPLADERPGGVRRAAQRGVLGAPLPRADPVDLGPDRDHRVAEPVDLGEVLGLGRLDHQRAGDRERHRRRVEAVVDEPLGDVVDGDAGVLGEAAQVEDALVGDQPAVAAVEHREVLAEPGRDVVGRRAPRPRSPGSARRRPSAGCRPTRSAGCPPSRTAPR